MEEEQVFGVVGEEGFRRLAAAFYRQIPSDDILGPMYPARDLAGAEERLGDFLIFRFGGPPTYLEKRGHPRLRMRHAGFPIDEGARNRWMQLMMRALHGADLPAEVRSVLEAFFASTSTFLVNRPVTPPPSETIRE